MKNLFRIMFVTVVSTLLSACLLTSPVHNQVIETTSTEFQLAVWTFDDNAGVVVGCKPSAWASGATGFNLLYSYHVASDSSNSEGWIDTTGTRAYRIDPMISLPEECWVYHQDGRYYTQMLVIDHSFYPGPIPKIHTLDQAGYECVVGSIAVSGKWASWMNNNCHRRDASTNEPVQWITLIANHV